MTDDNSRALSLSDAAQKEWEKKGIWVPNPAVKSVVGYALSGYNTTFCKVRDSEMDLFKLRMSRPDFPVSESALKLLSLKGVQEEYVF